MDLITDLAGWPLGRAARRGTASNQTLRLNVAADNTLTVDAGTGDVTITITSPDRFAGTYHVALDTLDSGPTNLVPPAISGVAGPGETLTAAPGLWIYEDGGSPPVITHQWQRDGAAVPGETDLSYGTGAADEGTALTFAETATGANGSRSALSDPLAIPSSLSPWRPVDEAAYSLELDFTNPARFYDDGSNLVIEAEGPLAPATITSTGKLGGAIDTFGGLQCFNRTGPLRFQSQSFPARSQDKPLTIAWLHAPNDVALGREIVLAAAGGGGSSNRFVLQRTGMQYGTSGLVGKSANSAADQFYICTASISDTGGNGFTIEVFVNGVSAGVSSQTEGTFTTTLGIGHIPNEETNAFALNGRVFGMVWFNTDTASVRQKIEGYWANRVGIALPDGHPYRAAPPMI